MLVVLYPSKKLRGDYRTSSGAATGGSLFLKILPTTLVQMLLELKVILLSETGTKITSLVHASMFHDSDSTETVKADDADMDLFAFIQVANPTKVRVVERERTKGEPKLLDFTVGRVVLLLPVASARTESELETNVDKLFDEGGSADQGILLAHSRKGQQLRMLVVLYPSKKLRGDYRTSSGAATGDIKYVLTQKGLDIFCHKFHIPDDVHPIVPTVGLLCCFYVNSKNNGWMSFGMRPDTNVVCYTKPLDSLKYWNDHFFWVDSFACPASFPWNTDKNISKDPFPKSTKFSVADNVILVAHPAPFQKFLKPLLCLVGIRRYYTMEEDTHPSFLHDDGIGLLACCGGLEWWREWVMEWWCSWVAGNHESGVWIMAGKKGGGCTVI
nr:hypothetical protein [Tanacetum cinerariifolium]